MNTNELARLAKSVRIFRKRLMQDVLPKSKRPLVALEPQDGKPVVAQLREILANKTQAKRLVEQLEIWDTSNDRHVSRKEFRRAFAFLGYTAPKHDMNLMFDELDTDGSGEVDFDELAAGLKRIQNGEVPRNVGTGAAKLAAKESASAEEKAAKIARKLAEADVRTRKLAIGVTPARVAPAARAPTKPPQLVVWDPVGAVSPAMARAANAVSPAVKHSLSIISPAVARAAGVSELYAQVYTPNTKNTQRLNKWAELANMEEPSILRPPARRQACA